MTSFAWRARDSLGRDVSGLEEASSPGAIAQRLRARGMLVVTLQPARPAMRAPGGFTLLPMRGIHVEQTLRQLALLEKSGVPLLQALRTAADGAGRRAMSKVLLDIAARIEAGGSLHDAFRAHPRQFPKLVCELIQAGEMSGTLERSFERGCQYLERRRLLRSSILSALFYPSIVLVLTIAVAAFLLIQVVPVLEQFLRGTHARLHPVTRALIEASHIAVGYGPFIAVGILLAIVFVALGRNVPVIDRTFDRALGFVPAIGRVRRIASTAMFAQTLGILIGSGIHLAQALPLVRGVLRRPLATGALDRAHQHVLHGAPLAEGLANTRAFTPFLARMVAVGEASGELERVLFDVADYHAHELALWIRRASALVEPVVTIAIGGVVGFVYLAFFLAMFSAAGGLR